MRATCPRIRSIALGCCSLLILAGCGASATTTPDLLTPDQGKKVALDWLHSNLGAEISVERGSLQRLDQAVNLVRIPPMPLTSTDTRNRDDTIWMPHQSQYPLTFLCLDWPRVPGQQTVPQLIRFYKADAQARWTVTHQVQLLSTAAS